MKTLILILTLSFTGIIGFSQLSNLIVFTEQGEKFYLVLNGIQQNAEPETNVKVTDLNAEQYKLKIIFEDKSIPDLDKNIYFHTRGNEYTFCVKQNKKGEYVLRYMGDVPVIQAPPPPAGQTTIVYTTTPPPTSGVNVNVSGTTTTINSTTTTGNPDGVSMGVNINDPDLGVNVNMNIGTGNATNTNVTYTETYTTTTTTTTTGNATSQPAPVYLPGYTGPVGCPVPMDPAVFNTAKTSIMTKTFEDDKLTVAKQIVSSNCLLSSQVKELTMLFDFEETKLDFAKFAYHYTYDLGNYFMVNDAFEYSSSIDELNNYILQNPK
ncbi:MAG: hypothetical protein Kow0068_10740 [Marinilabiliales bacterium]